VWGVVKDTGQEKKTEEEEDERNEDTREREREILLRLRALRAAFLNEHMFTPGTIPCTLATGWGRQGHKGSTDNDHSILLRLNRHPVRGKRVTQMCFKPSSK
jgi:hypothetical protein